MWFKIAAVCALFLHIKCSENFNSLENISFKTYILNSLNETLHDYANNITAECRKHLFYFVEDLEVEKLWALKLLDSMSKLPSGILEGNLNDLGTFDECLNTETTVNETEYVAGKYCLGNLPLKLPSAALGQLPNVNGTIMVKLASCVPETCTPQDVEILYESFSISFIVDNTSCQSKKDLPQIDVALICGTVFFVATALILLLSTLYEAFHLYKKIEPKYMVLNAFSVISNTKKIFKVTRKEDRNKREILCMNGIRSLSIIWIVIGHRISTQITFPTTTIFNKNEWVENPLNMIFINGQLAVDTFLLLSGALIVYTYMNMLEQKKPFGAIKYILHRYLRLTPALLVVIIFILTLLKYCGSGPFWPNTMNSLFIVGCQKYWWKTLIYIQNYGVNVEMCVPHGWYLSTDFQLYVACLVFLYIFKKSTKLAIVIVAVVLVCNMILCFLIGWFLELNTFIVANTPTSKYLDYVWYYHFPAYTRASTWLVGLLLGNLLHVSKVKKIKIAKITAIICWLISAIIMLSSVLAGGQLITGEYNKLANSIHMALVRPSWGFAVSWVIFACDNGYGGPINKFLSLQFFTVFSKLTYTLYLVHYIVIYAFTTQIRAAIVFNDIQALYSFCGDLVFSILAAFILCLCFELPILALEKHLWKKETKKPMTTSNAPTGTINEGYEETAENPLPGTLTSTNPTSVNNANVESTFVKIDLRKLICI